MSEQAVGDSRLRELDAVRGLAALTVVFGHCAIVLPAIARESRRDGLTWLNALKYSPVGGLLFGSAAVIVFFVLSGTVLTLQLRGSASGSGYSAFLTRRVCRLWIPYMAAVVLAVLLSLHYVGRQDPRLSGWFNTKWQQRPEAGSMLAHVTLIGSFRNDTFDPVLWSLVQEMRISIVLPLVVTAAVAVGAVRALVLAVAVALIGYVLSATVLSSSDYAKTLMYLLCFVVGVLIALHREGLVERVTAIRGLRLVLAFGIVTLLLTWPDWVSAPALPSPLGKLAHLSIVDISVMTVGAAALIVLAQRGAFARWLRRPVPQFLGRISYSLYLVHAIVLLLVLHAAGFRTATLPLLPLVIVVSIALATVMQALVERPAQLLGRRLTAPAPTATMAAAGSPPR